MIRLLVVKQWNLPRTVVRNFTPISQFFSSKIANPGLRDSPISKYCHGGEMLQPRPLYWSFSNKYLHSRFISFSQPAFDEDEKKRSVESAGKENSAVDKEDNGVWNGWISSHFSQSEKSEVRFKKPTAEEIEQEIEKRKSLGAVDSEKDELDLLLERTEEETMLLSNPLDSPQTDAEQAGSLLSRATNIQEDDKREGNSEDLTDLFRLEIDENEGNDESDPFRGVNPDEIDESVYYDLPDISEDDFQRNFPYPDNHYYPGQGYEKEDVLDLMKPAPPSDESQYNYGNPGSMVTPVSSKEALSRADCRNPNFLSRFMTEVSKINPRRKTKLSAKAQRKISREIRNARILGLLPFTNVGKPPFQFRMVDRDLDKVYRSMRSHDGGDDVVAEYEEWAVDFSERPRKVLPRERRERRYDSRNGSDFKPSPQA